MIKYITKRVLHMIPIVFGVILLTFLLFNVVGGSPAAMVLGKHTTAEELEKYEEQHGYNKPLFFGRWTSTRAFNDVVLEKPIVLSAGDSHQLAKTFTDGMYRWHLRVRGSEDCIAYLVRNDADRNDLSPAAAWSTAQLDTTGGVFKIYVEQGQLELASGRLRRRAANPLDSQLFVYLRQISRFDFGRSSQTNQKVLTVLKQGIMPSLMLTVPIFIGGLLVSLAVALICAWWRGRWLDRMLVIVATALMSMNYVIWVVAGQYIFAFKLSWFPIWGFESWRFLLLPVLIGIFTGLGRDVRFYRTIMLDEMYQDYIRTARAKGLRPGKILFQHVLRNALVPVITNVGMTIPFLFMGSLLLESFFGIPGLGGISINAINAADMNVVRAVVLIGALLYAAVNLITDLCYAWVDPRVRLT